MEVKFNCKNGSEYAEANPGDILSDFPDEMLSHILSFLPTEYAVRTSILSSRWKDVYKGVPNIKSSIDAYVLRMAVLEKIATLRVKMSERMAVLEKITIVRVKMSELHVKMRKAVEDINALEKLETMTASTSVQQSDTHDEEEDAPAAADDDEDDVGSEREYRSRIDVSRSI